MEILLVLTAGLITGILIGLFPVFPIYFAAFVIYLTASVMTPEQMLLFWLVASMGSQFFGSVSAISLGIPGDASSLPYINDIRQLTLQERQRLLWTTSRGSLISASLALCLVWVLYNLYLHTGMTLLSGVAVKTLLLYAVIIGVIVLGKRKIWTAVLALVGIAISPQNNYSLPEVWYHASITFQHTSFFMLIVALLMLPDLMDRSNDVSVSRSRLQAEPDQLPWNKIWKNSLLGCGIGLVPGPAAETASAAAYALAKKSPIPDRVLAAETANNPGVIMMLLPLMLLSIPFTASSMIMSNIMDARMIDLPELARSTSTMIPGITVFDCLILLGIVTALIYYALSIRFINFYTAMVSVTQTHLHWILILISVIMIVLDMNIQEIPAITYFLLLSFFSVIGIVIKYFHINPVGMIFCFLLGDQIIWSTQQFFMIYF